MSDPPAPRRPPYWTLPALVGLLIAPPWVLALAVAAAAGLVGFRTGRAVHRWLRRRAPVPAPQTETLIGSDVRGRPARLSDHELSAHGLILGASGAGKSTTLLTILTDQIRRGRSAVAIDLKGSPAFAHELRTAAEAAGRPFRIWTLDGPTLWNPLAHGNATELKDKLICTERFSEPHYQRAAERYVQMAIGVLHTAHPSRSATLDEVVEVMEPRRLAKLARNLPLESAERVHDYLATLTADQLSAVRGLGTRLAIVTESHTGRFLSPGRADAPDELDEIDLRRSLEGDEVVVFSLNSSTYGRLAAQVVTLVVQDLTTSAGHRLASNRPLPPAIVGIDEFSALGADNVLGLLARGREAGLPILLATQEMADLDRAARGLRDQVLGIVGLKVIHRQEVPASAQTIAQLAGTVRVWEETRRFGGPVFGGLQSAGGTRRQVERYRVHPNEIKQLPTGRAIVLSNLPRSTVRKVDVRPPRHERRGHELG
jgi:type IV secretory pathway TraG/TraD family ATPase VirD4